MKTKTKRVAARITVEELKSRIGWHRPNFDSYEHLIEPIRPDLKVQFDFENFELIGYRELRDGLTFAEFVAGGDWESPVYFVVYWDGKKLRAYVPAAGNCWNTKTKQAYGNNDAADAKDIRRRCPDYDRLEIDPHPDDVELDWSLLLEDVRSRIEVRPTPTPK